MGRLLLGKRDSPKSSLGMRYWEVNGIRDREDTFSGCGIVVKKERECGISDPYLLGPVEAEGLTRLATEPTGRHQHPHRISQLKAATFSFKQSEYKFLFYFRLRLVYLASVCLTESCSLQLLKA